MEVKIGDKFLYEGLDWEVIDFYDTTTRSTGELNSTVLASTQNGWQKREFSLETAIDKRINDFAKQYKTNN